MPSARADARTCRVVDEVIRDERNDDDDDDDGDDRDDDASRRA
jgi:hypothetical protein